MSLPKKGTRKININDAVFFWRISTKPDYLCITVQAKKGQLLLFSIPFTDAWLRLGLKPEQRENLPENEIQVITPSFVKKLIEFALANDWLLQNKSQPYKMTFTDREFKKIS